MVNRVFIGYVVNNKAFQFLDHKSEDSEIHVNTIIESGNTEFFEHIYPYKTECESTSERPKLPQEESMKNKLLMRILGVAIANGNPLLSDQILWHLIMSLKHLKNQCLLVS